MKSHVTLNTETRNNTLKYFISIIAIPTLFIGLLACLTLSGCTTPYEDQLTQQQAINQSCDQADVLLADLSKPQSQRIYSIKPGEACYV